MNFAVENHLSAVYIPTSEFALRNTDRKRTPGPLLFRRIYDEYVLQLFKIQRHGEWWYVNVHGNGNRIVPLDESIAEQKQDKTICICHNISERDNRNNIEKMLSIEKAYGVNATYQVSGFLHNEYKKAILENGHCISFYSYDCRKRDQLLKCREVDYRIKGYYPFHGKHTRELSDFNLAFHNFEWLAGSYRSIKIKNGIARIPMRMEDSTVAQFSEWKRAEISKVRSNDFTAIVLSDSNSARWLPQYEKLLEELLKLGSVKTLNQVSAQLFLTHSL
jgi:hypothetical protein